MMTRQLLTSPTSSARFKMYEHRIRFFIEPRLCNRNPLVPADKSHLGPDVQQHTHRLEVMTSAMAAIKDAVGAGSDRSKKVFHEERVGVS